MLNVYELLSNKQVITKMDAHIPNGTKVLVLHNLSIKKATVEFYDDHEDAGCYIVRLDDSPNSGCPVLYDWQVSLVTEGGLEELKKNALDMMVRLSRTYSGYQEKMFSMTKLKISDL